MKPCPMCGAMLAPALAAAIADPTRDESCPQLDAIAARIRLAYVRLARALTA